MYTDKAALQTALDEGRAALTSWMTELEFYRVLNPIVSLLECGHTTLSLSTATDSDITTDGRFVPFTVKLIDGVLYVHQVPAGSSIPAGSEIVEINGRTGDEIVGLLIDNLSADGTNLTWKISAINRSFARLYHRNIDESSRFSVTFREAGAVVETSAMVEGISDAEWVAVRNSPPAGNDGIGTWSFEQDHALLKIQSFNFYDPAGMQRFRGFVDAFFAELSTRRSPNLILDLRGNGGGEPRIAAHLFRYLIETGYPYFAQNSAFYPELKLTQTPSTNAYHGPLFVLVNGGCFSTTGHLVSLLRFHNIGRLIGEETGGSFSTTSNNSTATLGNTQLRFSYARNTFTTAVSGLTPGRGIFPHDPVSPTLDDYLQERDAVMEYALSLFRVSEPLGIVRQPRPVLSRTGGIAVLSVEAAGGDLTYQWKKNGVVISGKTAPALLLHDLTPADAGNYTVVVSDESGSIESDAGNLEVRSTGFSRLSSISARARVGVGNDVLITGFAISGSDPKQLLLRATGPALTTFGVNDTIADPILEIVPWGETNPLLENDNWQDAPAQAAMELIRTTVGAFPIAGSPFESSVFTQLSPGSYTTPARDGNGGSGIALVEAYDADPAGARSHLEALSVRGFVGEGEDVLIGGFRVAGDIDATLLIRAVGPGLEEHGVEGFLNDPLLSIHRSLPGGGSEEILGQDNWVDGGLAAAFEEAGRVVPAFPLVTGSADAAVTISLSPGLYSVIVSGADGGSGIALFEIYHLDPAGITD